MCEEFNGAWQHSVYEVWADQLADGSESCAHCTQHAVTFTCQQGVHAHYLLMVLGWRMQTLQLTNKVVVASQVCTQRVYNQNDGVIFVVQKQGRRQVRYLHVHWQCMYSVSVQG